MKRYSSEERRHLKMKIKIIIEELQFLILPLRIF